MLQSRPECLDILDVVDADDGFVAHEFLGLFHESLDAPVLAGDGHAEASGILHLVGVQHILAFARESPEVRVEQGVAEYDEQGLVVVCVGEREAYCLPQALRVALEYGAGLAPFGLVRQVAVHDFGLVAGDEDGLGGRELPGVAHDPVNDGLSADGQQALGQVVGVGAHAFALAGNGQNDLHIIPSSGLLRFSKQQQYCGVNVEKCLHLCEGRLRRHSQDGEFFLLRVAGWMSTNVGCKMPAGSLTRPREKFGNSEFT